MHPVFAVIATEAAAAANSDVLQLIAIRTVTLSLSDVVCESICSGIPRRDDAVFMAGTHRNPDSRNLLIPVGPHALSDSIADHSTEDDPMGFCGSTTSRPLLNAGWSANHQRHEPSNQRGTRDGAVC